MATRALDVVTILHALSVLNSELNSTEWCGVNSQQQELFCWLVQHREALAGITGLEALASRDYQALNNFLASHRFSPTVNPFDPNLGIGVVSVLDKLVRWINGEGEKVNIRTSQGTKPGFELPPTGVNIYQVSGYPGSTLLELLTQSGDTLWLFVHADDSLKGLDMVRLSMDVMNSGGQSPSGWRQIPSRDYVDGVHVLMVDFAVNPSLEWLLGVGTIAGDGTPFVVQQASQQFKLRMDETGARVMVATAVASFRGGLMKRRFIVDGPFYGWWTQKGVDLPMATFFADWDSLHKPAGRLEDL